MMQKPILSIIIVNYNVKEFLNQALDSIQKAIAGLDAEIIVVDNASRDESVKMVRENYPSVRLIENSFNVGFARANNQAISCATGRYLIFINPDTLVQEDTFRTLLRFFAEHTDAGMVGCKILNPDGSLQLACRRSIPTPWVAFTKLIGLSHLFPKSRWFGRYNLTFLNPDETTPVEAISGSFMMLRREVVDQVGMLDEQFFMYGEDLDWCYRIRRAGWKIYYVPGTKIVHYKGASTGKAKLDTILTFYRAMLLFARKHFRGKYLFLPQWFLILGIGIRAGISFLHNLFSRFRWPLIDLVVLNLSLVLALLLRFGSLVHWHSYLLVTTIYSLIWLLSFYSLDLYDHKKFSIGRATLGVMLGLIINSAITYFAKSFAFSRLVVVLAGGLNLFFIPGWRGALRNLSLASRRGPLVRLKKRYFKKEAILVGDSRSASNLLRKIKHQYPGTTEVVAAILTDVSGISSNGFANVPILTDVENLPWYIEDYDANEVIFSSDAIPYEKMLWLMVEAQRTGAEFKIASKKMEVIIGSRSVDYLGDFSLVDIDFRLAHAPYRMLKRSVDVLVSLLFLFLSLPLWLILPLRGYRLRRLPFYLDPSGKSESFIKESFPVAKSLVFVRGEQAPDSLLERLPLFFEVLRGGVTLVGSEIHFQPVTGEGKSPMIRLKPGLTSIAQASRWKQASEEERRQFEIYYLKNYSPIYDLEIFLKALVKR